MMTESHTRQHRHPASDREMKEEFILADRNRDGRIDLREFGELMNGLEAGMSATDLHIGFREIDADCDGLINYTEFVDWWSTD